MVIRAKYKLTGKDACPEGKQIAKVILKMFPKQKYLTIDKESLKRFFDTVPEGYWYLLAQAIYPWGGPRGPFRRGYLSVKTDDILYNMGNKLGDILIEKLNAEKLTPRTRINRVMKAIGENKIILRLR